MAVSSDTVAVGAEAPDFTLEAIDGSQVTLSSFRGKPVVLVFLRGFH
jgi:peroxiredoxin